ncbi:MAG TPA: hypothetical protein DIC42_06720 [Holosporales bacterium]|nr:hypothetical protein [Holosporales bacterium]
MKFLLFFICSHAIFYASAPHADTPYQHNNSIKTEMASLDSSSDDEGMGERQNAESQFFEEFPDEISTWRQIIGLFILILHYVFNQLIDEYSI